MHRIRWGVAALWLLAGTGLARANGLESINQKLAGRDFQNYAKALSKALTYRLYDIYRLENIILKYVAGDFFNLPEENNDERG